MAKVDVHRQSPPVARDASGLPRAIPKRAPPREAVRDPMTGHDPGAQTERRGEPQMALDAVLKAASVKLPKPAKE